jgi:tetratricopeptide (TPR) repeat protein
MLLRRLLFSWAVVLLALPAAQALTPLPTQKPALQVAPPWRPPVLQVAGAEQPVRLQSLQVQVDVAGGIAQTRVQMEFFNPNGRTLEGELQFPLSGGQTVTGFALDIDGVLRDAVPVDKAKAQQVFEDIARVRVDPGLLQSTLGNNYKLRIYPLLAGRSRTVALTITEAVGPVLSLPMAYASTVPRLSVVIRYPAAQAAPTIISDNPLALRFVAEGKGGWVARLDQTNASLPMQALRLRDAQANNAVQVSTERRDGADWFALQLPVAGKAAPRELPARIMLVWDSSGSARQRRFDQEYALLDGYFRRAGKVEVNLVRVADVAAAPERFLVQDGNWRALRKALESSVMDGASNLGDVRHDGTAAEVLWFSDGLSNYGTLWQMQFPVPVYAINSAASANLAALRTLADGSGGRLIDLTHTAGPQALASLLSRGTQVVDMQATGATDLVLESRQPEDGRLRLAGRFLDSQATITLSLRDANGHTRTQELRLLAGSHAAQLAAAQWARLKVAQLAADPRVNQGQIRAIGKRFGMVTGETSLLVLERVEDYVRHEIEPPASLREQYDRIMAMSRRQIRQVDTGRLANVIARFEARVAWWENDYPKDSPLKIGKEKKDANAAGAAVAAGTVRQERMAEADRRDAPAPMFAPPPASPAPQAAAKMAAPAAEMRRAVADALSKASPSPSAGDASIAIALKPASSDSTVLQRLRSAAPADWQGIYLDERNANAMSVGFFLDMAEFFFEKKQPAVALRILSNLAEMDLENRQILRLLAYRLTQAGQVTTALPIFERVLELAPNEPQSHRDLGLALAQAGDAQQAVERLYTVVTGQWDARFPDIDLIALTEMNAVIDAAKRAGKTVDVSRIEPRLLRHLPLDLRVVLAWDADNTDVDLHVIDPNGEEVYYGHRASYQGGAITRDATGGYGPEEFALKIAKPGKYQVVANFYGHRQQVLVNSTGLMLWLSSGFGTPGQKDQRTTVRVKSASGERVVIGEFVVQ